MTDTNNRTYLLSKTSPLKSAHCITGWTFIADPSGGLGTDEIRSPLDDHSQLARSIVDTEIELGIPLGRSSFKYAPRKIIGPNDAGSSGEGYVMQEPFVEEEAYSFLRRYIEFSAE
tara:strand:+ start:268 stop:615 length:348 start_codon:yes stop_codon:yes gene_type:complete